MIELWFYVPDYPAVRYHLEEAYVASGVTEHAAEPGRVGDCPDDADVHVRGPADAVGKFRAWLAASGIHGLMIEGRAR